MAMKNRERARGTIVRFLLAGAVNTCVGLTVSLIALHRISLPYWPATACGFAAGWSIGFVLSRQFAFRHDGPVRRALPRYAAVVVTAYLVAGWLGAAASRLLSPAVPGALLPGGLPALPREDLAVWLCNGFYTALNYAGQRYVVFREARVR